MKCEHGNEITVALEMESEYWDDGLVYFTQWGVVKHDGTYLCVSGCLKCQTVKFEIE